MSVAPSPAPPPPPEDREELLAWAVAHGVEARLDDLLVASDGPAGRTLPSRHGEQLTYRAILLAEPRRASYLDAGGLRPGSAPDHDAWRAAAARYLWRMATLTALAREQRSFLEEHGHPPEEPTLAAFAHRLLTCLRELEGDAALAAHPPGTFEPLPVRLTVTPAPMLRYQERPLIQPTSYALDVKETGLLCLGWQDGPLRWRVVRGDRVLGEEVPVADRVAALEGILAFLHDPRLAAEHEALREHLERPAWEFALGALDERLRGLGPATGAADDRLAFRVTARDAQILDVEPLVQKASGRGSYSRGSKIQWFQLPERKNLSPAERAAFQAYDDRFARRSQAWGGVLSAAQLFGILQALVDHPAVFIEGGAAGGARELRPDIRHGRLRLKFAGAADGSLSPVFELLGQEWTPAEVSALLREEAYLLLLHRPPHAVPQVLLAQVNPDTVAVMSALATVPRFPPASHDALARRLEPLQEKVAIEFPSTWTESIVTVPVRLLARLDLLVSGALHVSLAVRPSAHGALFPPGEGPALVLEGEGPERHGVRRALAQEQTAARELITRLGLSGASEAGSWSWRVSEGDPAFHVLATLEELAAALADDETARASFGAELTVEWSGDGRVTFHGGAGRGDMHLKIADRKDWFGVDGAVKKKTRLGEKATVTLTELFAAIREGRRYVAVGKRGFLRIEETLREALGRAEDRLVESRHGWQFSAAALVGGNPLRELVAEEEQIEATASFRALLKRLKEPPPELDPEETLGPAWRAQLRPYQKEGVAWMLRMAHFRAGVVLADEMGLGKTIQTLAVLALRAGEGPALVVAPTSVVGNWLDEAARFAPSLRMHLFRGPERAALLKGLGPGDVVVTSYTLATSDAEALAAVSFASLVLDEAQAVKNALTERSRALRNLDVRWRLGLTGTPIENHLSEVWSIFRVVGPGLFGSWEDFRARYAIPIEKFRDEGRQHALARRLRPFILRRTKAEVAPELPSRTELVHKITLSDEERALYDELRRATLDELLEAKKNRDRDGSDIRFVLLAALTRLRQLCCHPRLVYPESRVGSSKTAHLLELLPSLREDGHRVLVFSQFRTFLELLKPRLEQRGLRVLMLDGTTPASARTARIAAFQREEADVFLISLKAGGFGLNLTAADTVIHLDPWWNPAVEDQATARAHRIGQDKPVTALRLVAEGTLEEGVLGMHAAKRDLAASILAGSDAAATLDLDTLLDLIRANR